MICSDAGIPFADGNQQPMARRLAFRTFSAGRLEHAARFFPGRARTMIHLAHLSIDPRVRSVARAWHSLTEVERIETRIEELCRAAGISGADFIGCVAGTAWELGIDVAAFLTGGPDTLSR